MTNITRASQLLLFAAVVSYHCVANRIYRCSLPLTIFDFCTDRRHSFSRCGSQRFPVDAEGQRKAGGNAIQSRIRAVV